MKDTWFISYCTQNIDGTINMGCAIVNLHPLQVIQNYNNHLSAGVKKHILISWQKLSDEEIKHATFSCF